MIVTHIRHATCIIDFNGIRFLVDPILYKKNTLRPIKGGINEKNPLTDITISDEALRNIDYILLTHLHKDHFDPGIIDFFGRDIPVICNGEYEKRLKKMGLLNVYPIKEFLEINGIKITTTKGQHGTGVVGKLMGNSYGFLLSNRDADSLYITGDTVWCKSVEAVIENYTPRYILAFAGSATVINKHITMDEADLDKVLKKASDTKVIAIHMEAWNHCRLTRQGLEIVNESNRLFIPKDGETLSLS